MQSNAPVPESVGLHFIIRKLLKMLASTSSLRKQNLDSPLADENRRIFVLHSPRLHLLFPVKMQATDAAGVRSAIFGPTRRCITLPVGTDHAQGTSMFLFTMENSGQILRRSKAQTKIASNRALAGESARNAPNLLIGFPPFYSAPASSQGIRIPGLQARPLRSGTSIHT